MTRRDYLLLAAALNNVPCSVSDPEDLQYKAGISDAIDVIADTLKRANPAFDADLFRFNCLYDGAVSVVKV